MEFTDLLLKGQDSLRLYLITVAFKIEPSRNAGPVPRHHRVVPLSDPVSVWRISDGTGQDQEAAHVWNQVADPAKVARCILPQVQLMQDALARQSIENRSDRHLQDDSIPAGKYRSAHSHVELPIVRSEALDREAVVLESLVEPALEIGLCLDEFAKACRIPDIRSYLDPACFPIDPVRRKGDTEHMPCRFSPGDVPGFLPSILMAWPTVGADHIVHAVRVGHAL